MEPGFELAGRNATWTLEAGRVVISYSGSWGIPRLLRRIGKRVVPAEAIASARVGKGDGAPVLLMELRPGADPYLTAAAGQLPEDHDLYRLELEPGQEDLASYHAEGLRLRAELNPHFSEPSPEFLLDADAPPLRLKCYDGDAHLEPDAVRFRWNNVASGAKRKHGDTSYLFAELTGMEWIRPGMMSGHLAVRTVVDTTSPEVPEDDPRVILFGLGYGGVADSLPFAASLLVGIQRCSEEPGASAVSNVPGVLPPASATPSTPDEIVAVIRKLGELLKADLISQDEFERKKKELLDRL